MAYKQTPGRGNGKKTGGGLSPMLMGGSPMYQKKRESGVTPERIELAKKAVKSYKSNKKLSERDLQIEGAAAMDSIIARKDAGDTYTKRDLAKIGNKAAERTRKESGATTTVKRKEVVGKKGYEDKYTRTPVKQMSKLKSGKSPAKQVSKMPTDKLARDKRPTDTMERNRGGAEPVLRKPGGRTPDVNGTAPRPKASKKAPMKMKKC